MSLAGMREVRVKIPYTPRPNFRSYHDRAERWAVLLAHRRAGKTVATVHDLIKRALSGRPDARYAYMAPFFVQAKDIAWLYTKKFTAPLMGHGLAKINESELSITLAAGQVIGL